MIQSFDKDGKNYYCKQVTSDWSQWSCKHEDGLETWTGVYVKSSKLKRQDVIDAIDAVDEQSEAEY